MESSEQPSRDPQKSGYIIRGGREGRERLRMLSRILRQATIELLERAGLRAGMHCLDIGCGGGDVCIELARMVGSGGRVVGMDVDQVKIEMARSEAEAQNVANVEFRRGTLDEGAPEMEYDFVYARFLLSHLEEPARFLRAIRRAMRPGAILAVVDTDFRGHFCEPECPAFWRYVELYTETLRRRGGDANIGPRLPGLLAQNGFENVRMNVVQPAGMEREVKRINPVTMENIADSVLAEGLASREEIDRVVTELYEFARASGSVMSMVRLVEAWGRRPKRGKEDRDQAEPESYCETTGDG